MAADFQLLSERLYALILAAERGSSLELLEAEARHSSYEEVMAELLDPTLRRIGERWSLDRVSLAQGYVAGKVAEDFLARAAASLPAGERSFRGRAVLGNIEDDYHGLGRSMVSAFLRVKGWEVLDLGSDVAPLRFVEEALEAEAPIIGVSAMMLSTARNILGLREEIERRGLGKSLKLAVGGAVFAMRPELAREFGGDGSARTAMDAPALFAELLSLLEVPA